jgi:hypothetical protein
MIWSQLSSNQCGKRDGDELAHPLRIVKREQAYKMFKDM